MALRRETAMRRCDSATRPEERRWWAAAPETAMAAVSKGRVTFIVKG